MTEQIQRRPIPMRQAPISAHMASALVGLGLSPNQVSIASTIFALAGAACFILVSRLEILGESSPLTASALLAGAALCILGRLLCNMLDGMMAVEYGKRTATGELYNEIPDRLSDTLFLASAGYLASDNLAALCVGLGWMAAVLALCTAYIRAFGARYMPNGPDYGGPMAKPQRMAALAIGALITAVQINICAEKSAMVITLAVICAGTALTCLRRLNNLAAAMTAAEKIRADKLEK
ncbi:MAG: CDP-alcohol phosphatidyltransferase family protein [Cyanobacteria bacterium REEB67]|nr:CDP-alcohol phosphatidyltransferase family protein [Cyanobacteria bacterium REEB67]